MTLEDPPVEVIIVQASGRAMHFKKSLGDKIRLERTTPTSEEQDKLLGFRRSGYYTVTVVPVDEVKRDAI